MRGFVLPIGGLLLIALAGCSGGRARDDGRTDDTSFPSDYRAWKKLNAAIIIREAEREARDLYANPTAAGRKSGSYPVGSVLVKEERMVSVDPGGQLRPGDLFRVSVMYKIGTGDMSGWKFRAFDPATREELPRDRIDPDGCYFCHADARQNDYVFSSRQ
ncbi:MAG: cytochrome P460 family protein [Deltaproteobacteria bacterium]|nr:cytochrome P460 family protein [Deltaproteobacteria bacterium]